MDWVVEKERVDCQTQRKCTLGSSRDEPRPRLIGVSARLVDMLARCAQVKG